MLILNSSTDLIYVGLLGEIMALSATLDKSSYNVGDTMILTVTSDKRKQSQSFDVGAGGETVTVTTTVTSGVTVSDPDRSWTKTSDDGSEAKFTSKA